MYAEARARLVDWLEHQLMGPASGKGYQSEHQINMSPLDRYPVGVLYAVESAPPGIDPASVGGTERADSEVKRASQLQFADDQGDLYSEEDDEPAPDGVPDAAEQKATPIRRRRYVPPSSVGFSFCARGDLRLRIETSAAVYEQTDLRDERGRFAEVRYSRSVLDPTSLTFSIDRIQRQQRHWIWPCSDGAKANPKRAAPREHRAGLDVRSRPHDSGTIVTVTLFNCRTLEGDGGRETTGRRVERSLFEATLRCFVEAGQVVDYPRVDPSLLTDEERELELQYRERRIFAVGHGAAVDWEVRTGEPGRIWSSFLPRASTPLVSVEARGNPDVLHLDRLSGDHLPLDQIRTFVDEYAEWVRERRRDAAELANRIDREAARRITDRMETAHMRMRRGVDLLGSDSDAALAFRLANRAMLRQMVQFRGESDERSAWRPFQLGFLLATIKSTVSEEDDDRDIVDLIWFQTGGGKTEAYLGLIAFLLVWRRLRYGTRGGGTAALMRYTLRLLTRQQFERAAGLICALELLRRENPEVTSRLGTEPFSVGIWVGGRVSPNRIDEAVLIAGEIRAIPEDGEALDKERNRLLLSKCPWCGSGFDAEWGYEVDLRYRDFRFHCTNRDCEFGRREEPLPCRVVDESLYSHPPSLLIATVDKFARLAWEERAGAFFGAGNDRRPPDLVLQDELHLISGPLGSVAGIYEAGIETAIRCRGVKPKYVASTATIRMAREQVRALYGRDVAVFPPPGLSADDSWFARTDRSRPSRLYLGYLAPLRDQQHCLAPLAAALLAGPLILFGDDANAEALFEAWWTNVVYHGSLRGVGTSSTAFESDVREFGDRLIAEHSEAAAWEAEPARARSAPSEDVSIKDELRRRFRETQFEQLWSRHTAEQIAETFERLGEARGSERCLDAVLSTNMVSVGLDVSRLALMIVNGQPLTTGEYVQATSRVGRDKVPGVVVANYYRHQARSISHYESFRPYHESFYRFVEPGSVTPFTFQVRKRALHAALVIALRHSCNALAPNDTAGYFDPEMPEVRKVVAELKCRVQRACPEKATETSEDLDRLVQTWAAEAERNRQGAKGLHYKSNDQAYARLLYAHEDGNSSPGLWPTLNSMRNVESPAALGMR